VIIMRHVEQGRIEHKIMQEYPLHRFHQNVNELNSMYVHNVCVYVIITNPFIRNIAIHPMSCKNN